ncbi:MAG: DUF3299 domain-containing protein [Gammaproteobacteria bacterium]
MKTLVAALGLCTLLATSSLLAANPAARDLTWDELVPPAGQTPPPMPGKAAAANAATDPAKPAYVPLYTYNPVASLDGKYVKLPGYIVPLESDAGGMLDEFLLVPYYGACIHVPPPPPNQIVYVKLKKPFNLKSMADPYTITGTITTKPWTGDVADSDYVMAGDKVELVEWKD